MSDRDITLAMILQHLQGMESRLRTEFGQRFDGMDNRFDAMGKRFDYLERKVDLLSVQVGNIDARIDDIEVVQIPALQRAVSTR